MFSSLISSETQKLPKIHLYLEVGMDDFLAKPFLPDELYRKINHLVIKSIKVDNNVHLRKTMPMTPEQTEILRLL